MPDATCSVDDCDKPAIKRGWCNGHYKRWWRHGSPTGGRREKPSKCDVVGCQNVGQARGWCNTHYQRWLAYGDPSAPLKRDQSIGDRLAGLTNKTEECWEWVGAKSRTGYGRFRMNERTVQAHRATYELLVGRIPEGLELDHLCRNRACVNPAHLEPVTHDENLRRARVAP